MKRKPPIPQIVQHPTLQYSKMSEYATSRGTEDEDSVLSRLRSLRIFDQDMEDEVVRLFRTPGPLAGNERTTQVELTWLALISLRHPFKVTLEIP